MNERLPKELNRKIGKQVTYLLANCRLTDDDLIREYNASYGKYAEAIMDCNGTVVDHYIDKEAYKRIAAMRGIEI